MEHLKWLRILQLCWWCCIFIGLMICPCRATAVNAHCITRVYDDGRSASITCHFSKNLLPILTHYGGYVMEHKTKDDRRHHVIEAYWKTPESFSHVVKDGYYISSDEVTDNLTVIIPHFADRFKGRYRCALFPSKNGKHEYCTLDGMSPNSPVVFTARSTAVQLTLTPNTTETQSHSTPNSGLVLTIVFPVLACIVAAAASALVFFMWSRRKRSRRFHQPTTDLLLPTTGREAIMGKVIA